MTSQDSPGTFSYYDTPSGYWTEHVPLDMALTETMMWLACMCTQTTKGSDDCLFFVVDCRTRALKSGGCMHKIYPKVKS